MHIASKVLLGIGVIITGIGIVMFAMGADKFSELEDWKPTFSLENSTSGNITIIDLDGKGELGYTFYMKGNYVDEDENGRYDACENANITVSHDGQTNTLFSGSIAEANESENKYYEEVGEGFSGCSIGKEGEDSSLDNGLIKIGRACYGCMNGTSNITSNVPVWVTYDDQNIGEVVEDVVEGGLGILGGIGGLCCGIIFLIIGGILAITLKDKEELTMGMSMDGTGAVMVTQMPGQVAQMPGQGIPTLGAQQTQPVQESGPTITPDQE